ncbi:hypothetical protein GCM10023319_29780 [Nocardia iowensis]
MEAPGPRTGTRFGPYELRSLLGKGGMGEVYEAYDTVKGRVVAVKLLHEELAGDPTYQLRFRRESQAAARVAEPHIIPIHDWGVIDGVLFIDMMLVPGVDLRTLLRKEGPLSPVRAVGIIEQIASALDAAHAGGLIHRDVKPANILVTAADFAYLADFGIAHTEGDSAVTVVGMAVGSYIYMAPERFDVAQVTGRADIYSLSCVLHECLTGASPFPAASMNVLIKSHLSDPPPRPSAQQAGIPAGLDAVISRGMAKDPADRWPTAAALAMAARDALSSAPSTNLPPVGAAPAGVPAANVPPQTGPMLVVRAPASAGSGVVPPESTGEISAVILPSGPTVVRPTETQFTPLSSQQEPVPPLAPPARWTPDQALPPVRPFPDAHLYSEQSGGQAYSEQAGGPPYSESGAQPYSDQFETQVYSEQSGSQPYPEQYGAQAYSDRPGAEAYPEQSGGQSYPEESGAQSYSEETRAQSYPDQPGAQAYSEGFEAQPHAEHPKAEAYSDQPGAYGYPESPQAYSEHPPNQGYPEHPGAQAYSAEQPYPDGQAYFDAQEYETRRFPDAQGYQPPPVHDDYPADYSATQAYSAPAAYSPPQAYSAPDEYSGPAAYSDHGGHARPDYPPQSNYANRGEYQGQGYADDYADYGPEEDPYDDTGKRRSIVLPILVAVATIVVIAVVGAVGWQVFGSTKVAPTSDQHAGAPAPTAAPQATTPGTSSAPPVTSTPAKPTTVTLPAGAKPCSQGDSASGGFSKSATGSAATTCAFAEEVRRVYAQTSTSQNVSREAPRTVVATSPVTGRTYTMNCLSEGQLVTCSGGENAVVYVY